jgi:hypothetical protein
MNESFTYSGFWWLPEKPENQVPGRLEYTPTGGIVLELQGNLHPRTKKNFGPSLILGLSEEGKDITLQHCQLTRISHTGTSGYGTSSLAAATAFRGTHFQNPEDVKFRSLSVRYAHLDEWFLTTDFDVRNNIHKENRLTVQYEPPIPVKVEVDDYEVGILTKWGMSHSFHKQVTLTQEAWVRFRPEQARFFEVYSDIVHHTRNFLSLALSVPTYPLSIAGATESGDLVDVFYRQPHLPAEIKTLDRRHMLFTFPVVRERFAAHITNWVSKAKELAPVYDLYFSVLYNRHQYIQSAFLSLTQAVETYHRRAFGGEYLSSEEYLSSLYKKFVEAIPAEVDKDFRQSLKKGSLYFANQFSLRKRLKVLANELSDSLSIGFLGTAKARDAFVERVCGVRNYLTHYDPNQQIEIVANELQDLTEKLETLLCVCLLKELDFSYDDIKKMTRNHWKYKCVFRRW